MRIRIEATQLPGAHCGPGPDFPEGHHNIHVAVQGKKGPQDLYGLTRADAPSVVWELGCEVAVLPPAVDLRGPHVNGGPNRRFLYLAWGVVDDSGFRMFRRAKLMLDGVPVDVLAAAHETGLLIGQLGLTDDAGWPLCAAVRPPRIRWLAGAE